LGCSVFRVEDTGHPGFDKRRGTHRAFFIFLRINFMEGRMVERTRIADLGEKTGQVVKIQGWLQALRDQKKMQFLVIRDATGLVQVTVEKQVHPELAAAISRLASESTLTITGGVVPNPVVRLGGLEVILETLQVESQAEPQLPLDPFAEALPAIDIRMDWRFLDLRRPSSLLLQKVQTRVEMAMREYWVQHGFLEIHTPKLMGTPSESGAELFELPYFDTKAYLAQSPQFYKQMAMAAGFDRVFEVGPAFRADPSFTSRHMTEFTSVDVEMSWIDSHEDVMSSMEQWLAYVVRSVKDMFGAEIEDCFGVDIRVPLLPFPRITMEKAQQILAEKGYRMAPEKKGDIDPGGERLLGEYVREQYGHDFLFLTDWPIGVRPFYHMRHSDDPGLTCSFDLIGYGLEISTGAQREHRLEILTQQALEKGLGLDPIRFYLDFFRYGCPPHGGFGLGLSRLVMILLGLQNIRETVFIFRGPTRLHP
jgi:nondiscriminating aspartyl-tRNA synthetase